MVGANPHYVSDAKKIEQDAPELLDEVIRGRLNIPQVKRVAALPAPATRLPCPEEAEGVKRHHALWKLWHGESGRSEVLYRVRGAAAEALSGLWGGESAAGEVL
jgi:hypothetical protein